MTLLSCFIQRKIKKAKIIIKKIPYRCKTNEEKNEKGELTYLGTLEMTLEEQKKADSYLPERFESRFVELKPYPFERGDYVRDMESGSVSRCQRNTVLLKVVSVNRRCLTLISDFDIIFLKKVNMVIVSE